MIDIMHCVVCMIPCTICMLRWYTYRYAVCRMPHMPYPMNFDGSKGDNHWTQNSVTSNGHSMRSFDFLSAVQVSDPYQPRSSWNIGVAASTPNPHLITIACSPNAVKRSHSLQSDKMIAVSVPIPSRNVWTLHHWNLNPPILRVCGTSWGTRTNKNWRWAAAFQWSGLMTNTWLV